MKTASHTGTGPVDAVFKAIDTIVGVPNRLQVYSVHSVTSGMDSLAEVTLRMHHFVPAPGNPHQKLLLPWAGRSRMPRAAG